MHFKGLHFELNLVVDEQTPRPGTHLEDSTAQTPPRFSTSFPAPLLDFPESYGDPMQRLDNTDGELCVCVRLCVGDIVSVCPSVCALVYKCVYVCVCTRTYVCVFVYECLTRRRRRIRDTGRSTL